MPKVPLLDHNEIRRLAITAVFADDYFFERVVLKGGNALALALGISGRTSLDLDFSIENDFEDADEAGRRLEAALSRRFASVGLIVFDFEFGARPFTPNTETPRWGGYAAAFKLMEEERYRRLKDDREALSRSSLIVGPEQQRKFSIDLSKFEYTKGKLARELDHFDIYVYTPEMIAIEKLRAICQQMPGYTLNKKPSARARDCYDIHRIVTETKIDLSSAENIELLKNIFAAKEVPLEFLHSIAEQREFHRPDWESVRDQVPREGLESFDFYFDFVLAQVKLLKPSGDVKSPL
jgi:predicted nucleotidyltransferase component of viral defense system